MPKKLRIALDYDNTFTADPMFWQYFVEMAKDYGHTVTIVTMRSATIDAIADHVLKDVPVGLIYCDGNPKRKYCKDNHDTEFDIWIDDHPEGIHLGSAYTPEQLIEWRANGRV